MTAWDMPGESPFGRKIRRIRDTAGGSTVRPRRLRTDEEASFEGVGRREQQRQRVLQLTDERLVERQLEAAQQPAVGWRIGALTLDADGFFAFAIFLPLLFIAQLQTLGAAAVVALVPLYAWVRRERLLRTLWPRSFLFLVPAFALFSVIWSEAPKESFKLAIELGLTVFAGLLLSSARDQGAVLRGLCAAFFTYVAVSFAFGGSVAVGVGVGGYAFSGLGSSKNLLGDIASTGLIISIAVLMLSIKHRAFLWGVLAALGILLDLYVVLAARSAGALLGLAMGACTMLALAPLLLSGKVLRGFLTGVVTLGIIAAGLSYRWLTQAMIDFGARVFEKDPTLTGRTYLWYRAGDLIHEKPVLGRGYQAFWMQGNIDAEGLWRYFGIAQRGGFSFHNTAVELLVTLGWVGLILTAAVVAIGVLALIRRFVDRPTIALLCWISILLYQLSRTPIETIGIAPFYFSTALGFAALGAAFGRVHVRRAARSPYQAPNVIQLRPVDYSAPGWANARPVPSPGALRLVRRSDPSAS